MGRPNGPALIEWYYRCSPEIVAAIEESEDPNEILDALFAIIRVCVDAIKRGDDALAYRSHCQMVVALKEALIPELDAPIPAY